MTNPQECGILITETKNNHFTERNCVMMTFVFATKNMSKAKAFFSKKEGFCEACSYQDKQKQEYH